MITITKDKIYHSQFSLKKTRQDSELVREVEVDEIVFFMGEYLELGEDVTFERIFDIIIFHKEFFNILFSSEMNGLEVDDFIFDYEQKFESDLNYQKYVLRLFWSGIVYEINKEIEYYDYPAFEAFGKLDTRIDISEYPISISFSSLSEFRSKLVVVDNTFEILDEESYENGLEASFRANYKPFTVSNLMASILCEISYYGSPEDRELLKKESEKKSLEINDWTESESTIKNEIIHSDLKENFDDMTYWDMLYPSKPSKNKIRNELSDETIEILEESEVSLEEQMQKAEETENYELAAKIKKLIDKRDQRKRNKK